LRSPIFGRDIKLMSPFAHRIYIITLSSIVIFTAIYLAVRGTDYYATALDQRFFHPDHNLLKPSGMAGHGLGLAGSLLIMVGVSIYMLRKRLKVLSRLGKIKHWLEFHIFLCTLGPVMILYHTAFKFGGLVAISFWSMVAVVASGVLGRFIYLQIPRSIEGKELSLQEVKNLQGELTSRIEDLPNINSVWQGSEDFEELNWWESLVRQWKTVRQVKRDLKRNNVNAHDRTRIVSLVRNELALSRRITRLETMQRLFRYWHVAHLPFAIVMLTIMLIHVAVVLLFGNT